MVAFRNTRHLFFIDGAGAFLTATLLFFLVGKKEAVFGFPRDIVHVLGTVALFFSAYSFIAAFRLSQKRFPDIRIMAIANLLYCTATFTLLLVYWNAASSLGRAYFAGEIVIISLLASWEWRKGKTGTHLGQASAQGEPDLEN